MYTCIYYCMKFAEVNASFMHITGQIGKCRSDSYMYIVCKLLSYGNMRSTFEGRIRAPIRGNTVAPPNSTSDICDVELAQRERERWR